MDHVFAAHDIPGYFGGPFVLERAAELDGIGVLGLINETLLLFRYFITFELPQVFLPFFSKITS